MKNKFLVLFLAFIMGLSMVGCSNKNNQNTTKNNATENTTNNNGAGNTGNNNATGGTTNNNGTNMVDEEYYNAYTKNYNSSLMPLQENYSMYGSIDTVENYYKENDYPGNKKYLEQVRKALTDSRDNVQQFVDNMEKDAKSGDEQINKLNKEMIKEGRDLVKNIDERLKKLDEISDKDLKKSDTEFRRIVGERIMFEEEGQHGFRNMLRDLDERLNIDRKDMLDTTQ